MARIVGAAAAPSHGEIAGAARVVGGPADPLLLRTIRALRLRLVFDWRHDR